MRRIFCIFLLSLAIALILPKCIAIAETVRAHSGEVVYLKMGGTLIVNKTKFVLSSFDEATQKDIFLSSPFCAEGKPCPFFAIQVTVGPYDVGQAIEILKADSKGSLVVIPIKKS